MAVAFVRLYLEVECGRRPRHTVERFLTSRLSAKLADHWVRLGPARRVGAARGIRAADDVYEAVVVAHGAHQSGAVAVRLQRHGRRWRIEDAVRPEDGVLPEPRVWVPTREPCAFTLLCTQAELDNLLPLRAKPQPEPADVLEPAEVPALAAAVGL